MAAYIDEHESRFKVGPTCRVLSESLDMRFPHAARLPNVQVKARQPHAGAP